MNRKIKIIISGSILGLLVAVVSGYYIFKDHIFEIVIEKSQIQDSVNSKLPFQKTYFVIFQAAIDSAQVILEDGSDRSGIDSAVKLNIVLNDNNEELGCGFIGSGKIRYEKQDSSFYLDDLNIEKLNIQGVPEKYQGKISSIAALLLKDHFARKPIYKLNQGSLKIQLARAVLKDVKIINGKLYVYLGY